MVTQRQHLLEQVLRLSPIERVQFVESVLMSFELPSRQTIDQLWGREAEDRIDAYERGDIRAIPAREVFANIEKEQRV